jgi:pimeloyl-ACP methyl ester carboxylesterase
LPYLYPELPRQEADVLGIRTSYRFAGQPCASVILLLHGTISSGDAFREVMNELADKFWLIAPDLPGFGFSENTEPYTMPHLVEWLASFREVLDLPPMMLVGHSFGGALATSYTVSYPEDVRRLLLVAPAILAGDLLPAYLKRLGLLLGLFDLGAAVSQWPRLADLYSGRPFYDPNLLHEGVWPRRKQYVSQSRAASGVLKALAFQKMTPQLRKIKQPVSIIWGKNDPVLPARQGQRIMNELPDAQLTIWEECGHLPFLEKQDKFVEEARCFFSR